VSGDLDSIIWRYEHPTWCEEVIEPYIGEMPPTLSAELVADGWRITTVTVTGSGSGSLQYEITRERWHRRPAE